MLLSKICYVVCWALPLTLWNPGQASELDNELDMEDNSSEYAHLVHYFSSESEPENSLETRHRQNGDRRHRHNRHHHHKPHVKNQSKNGKLECELTTFGMVFPNNSNHHAVAYRNISQFIGKLYFCAWIYPTKSVFTLLNVVQGRDTVLQVEVDMKKQPPKMRIYWKNRLTVMNADGMKPNAWSHVCFEATKDKICHLYVNNRQTHQAKCQSPSGWLKGRAVLGQKTDPKTGQFVPGAAFTGVIAALQMTRMDVLLGVQNTKLGCMYKKCEKSHHLYPGDKSDLLYWTLSEWTLRDLSLKQFEVPCDKHNVGFILNKPNVIGLENDVMDFEHEQRVAKLKARMAKMRKLAAKALI